MEDSTIKSARRTLQIFEIFAELRRPATVTEIYRRLNLPQSSVSKLLRSFVKLGYLEYDREQRTYVPTLRTAILSGWLHDQWFSNDSILHVMEFLRAQLKTSVILGIQNDKHVLYMLALQGTLEPRPALPIGTLRPICRAAVGKALLMTKSDKDVGLLVRRINSEENDRTNLVDYPSLLEDLGECRQRGYALSNGAVVPGVNVVAVPLPKLPGQPQMALGIGAPDDWVMKNLPECVATLQRTLRISIKV